MSFQDKFYKNKEANAFFKRHELKLNNNVLRNNKHEILKILKSKINLDNKKVLEVGCFVGDLLYYIKKNHKCNVFGIEPSSLACKYAKKKFALSLENNTFDQSTISLLTKKNSEKFDLIIVEDVLSWIDRSLIFKTLASLDWLLKPNGHIFLRDFAPNKSFAVKNHHCKTKKIYNFKQSFGHKSYFLMSGKYVSLYTKTTSTSKYQLVKSSNKDSLIWNDSIIKKIKNFTFPILKI